MLTYKTYEHIIIIAQHNLYVYTCNETRNVLLLSKQAMSE